MPSSVHSSAPRLADLRANSSTSIHIDREVTVVSSSVDGLNGRGLYSTMPAHSRAQSSQGPNSASEATPVLSRWNSTSKMSSHQRSQNSTELAANKESMRALADFLMRSEPPPSNYMSRPESDAGSLHSIKKSAFKIFGRQKNKKYSKAPKLLQLPDSAVAATTTNGARHIAISIPLEYDYPYYENPVTSSAPSSRPQSQSRAPGERAAVTVLKPVVEVRESGSSILNNNTKSEEDEGKRASRAGSIESPAVDVLGPETTRTLENYYTQLHRQQRSKAKSSNAEGKQPQTTTPAKSFVAVTPVSVARQDSARTDPRHSGGTAYSATSTGSASHSRGPSSASSAPSAAVISGLRLELPPRRSSVTKVSPTMQAELAKSYAANKPLAPEDVARSSFISEHSAAESTSSGTIIGTAETAQSYNAAAGLQTISRSNTPKTLDSSQQLSKPLTPAPTRQLPDVPESPCIPSFLPSPSPPNSRRHTPALGVIDDAVSTGRSTPVAELVDESKQSRLDRVKARKQRDMAMHRTTSSTSTNSVKEKALISEPDTSINPEVLVTTSPKSVKPESIIRPESIHKRGFNAISEIMLVADLPPYTGEVTMDDLPLLPSQERATKKRVKDSDSNGTLSARGTHTPPSSAGSETDNAASGRLRSRVSKNAVLDARRQERRVKRNMSLKDKEMDARLGKLERDNTMLMTTLSGIATSFSELSRVLPRTALQSREPHLLTDVDREIADGGDESLLQMDQKP